MYGIWNFYKECQRNYIKPILGVESFVAPLGRKTHIQGENPGSLVLLAKNITGYRNLTRLTSRSNTEGFFHHPRVDTELLKYHGEGLIVLSSGKYGEIPRLIESDSFALARERAEIYARLFPGRFYLEIQDNGLPGQKELNSELKRLSDILGLPLAAANECYYLSKEDRCAFEVLESIRTRKPLTAEPGAPESRGGEKHFKSPSEIRESLKDYPEAVENTLLIAEEAKLEFPQKRLFSAPRPDIGESTKNSEDYGVKVDDFFLRLAREGLEKRLKDMEERSQGLEEDLVAIYKMRLREETEAFLSVGASQYVLVVADFVAAAKKRGVLIGPGRGLASSSLVNYALGITDVDPIEHGLMFESFLNAKDRDFPSITVEAPPEKVEEIIGYISDVYGGSHFAAHSLEFTRLKGRSLVREVGNAFSVPLKEMDDLCGMLPTHTRISIRMALREISLFKDSAAKNPMIKKIIDYCLVLEDLPRSAGANPNSLIVSPRLLRDSVPLFLDYNSLPHRSPLSVVQYDDAGVEENGLLCFDVAPIKNLSLQSAIIRLIEKKGETVSLSSVSLKDPLTFALLSKGGVHGVPFLENYWIVERLSSIPKLCFSDLTALRAAQPPFFPNIEVFNEFLLSRKKGVPVPSPHPRLDPILRPTYGFILYQEQLAEIIGTMTGESSADSDLLIRFINSPRSSKYEELRARMTFFVSKAASNGFPESFASDFWTKLIFHARNSPSKSFCVSMALGSYWTAYLKAHYPTEFLDAIISSEETNAQEREKALKEWRESNIRLVPPPGRA
jgi:DNA polymerase-3 subunit alpha